MNTPRATWSQHRRAGVGLDPGRGVQLWSREHQAEELGTGAGRGGAQELGTPLGAEPKNANAQRFLSDVHVRCPQAAASAWRPAPAALAFVVGRRSAHFCDERRRTGVLPSPLLPAVSARSGDGEPAAGSAGAKPLLLNGTAPTSGLATVPEHGLALSAPERSPAPARAQGVGLTIPRLRVPF